MHRFQFRAAPKTLSALQAALLLFSSLAGVAYGRAGANVSGTVRDSSGAVVSDAAVSLLTSQQATVGAAKTDSQGRFTIPAVPGGQYLLVITSLGFASHQQAVSVGSAAIDDLEVVLNPGSLSEEVTVTTNPGVVETTGSVSQRVNVIGEDQIEERAKSIVAQVANEEAGVHLQRTSPSIAGIFVRGLTGNKVNVFIDGVRYSTSAMRGGISTFLGLIDPAILQGVEILRGPNSAQYGSDAIGGSVQFLTRTPYFSTDAPNFHGKVGTFFNSADAGFGSSLVTTYATKSVGLLANLTGRRVNTLRGGQGVDSHSAVTRFLGLSSDLVIDGRYPDTAFTEYGGFLKLNWSPSSGSQISASYLRSQQDYGKRFDQLLGGDGNLIADLRNFMLDFVTLRYDKVKAGWFDNVSIGYSFNSQREERVNQGGNGNPNGAINHEPERTNVHGVRGFAGKQWGVRNNLVLGGDYYHERINALSYGKNPVTGVDTLRRGRVPHNAAYKSGGLYAQDLVDAIRGRLRFVGNVRYSAASYTARAGD